MDLCWARSSDFLFSFDSSKGGLQKEDLSTFSTAVCPCGASPQPSLKVNVDETLRPLVLLVHEVGVRGVKFRVFLTSHRLRFTGVTNCVRVGQEDANRLPSNKTKRIRSPAEGEGHEGFPPPPDKDLESPSSTRLEALAPPVTREPARRISEESE